MKPVAWDETAPSREYVDLIKKEIEAQRVTLSAANTAIEERDKRIADLEAENARHLAEIDRKSSMPGDYRYWEGRYRDEAARAASLEAMVVEAGKAIDVLMLFGTRMANACYNISRKLEVSSLDKRDLHSAQDEWDNVVNQARSIAAKIGGRNGE